MSFKIKWLAESCLYRTVGKIYEVDSDGYYLGDDGYKLRCWLNENGEKYEIVKDSVSSDSNDKPSSVTLIRYNGKLYDKKAFEEAIQGLTVYCVE